jgi:hypothetical protein
LYGHGRSPFERHRLPDATNGEEQACRDALSALSR